MKNIKTYKTRTQTYKNAVQGLDHSRSQGDACQVVRLFSSPHRPTAHNRECRFCIPWYSLLELVYSFSTFLYSLFYSLYSLLQLDICIYGFYTCLYIFIVCVYCFISCYSFLRHFKGNVKEYNPLIGLTNICF